MKNPKFDTLSKLQNTCTCTHYWEAIHKSLGCLNNHHKALFPKKFLKNLEFQPLPMAADNYERVFDTMVKKMSVTTNNDFELSELMI